MSFRLTPISENSAIQTKNNQAFYFSFYSASLGSICSDGQIHGSVTVNVTNLENESVYIVVQNIWIFINCYK